MRTTLILVCLLSIAPFAVASSVARAPEFYTLTGAADFKMLSLLGGVSFAAFNVIILTLVWRWINSVTQALKDIHTELAGRKQAENDLQIKLMDIAHDFQTTLSQTMTLTIERLEEKSTALHQAHNKIRSNDISEFREKLDSLSDRLALHTETASTRLDQGLALCHNRREEQAEKLAAKTEKVAKDLKDCQESRCGALYRKMRMEPGE